MYHTGIKGGDFTLPGEAGYEDLTLRLAKKWGADVIRDSDGTQLSEEIMNSDYGIYSTICLIRSDNAWAKKNMDKLQQNFLMSHPVIAKGTMVEIPLLAGYFKEQFIVNDKEALCYWQVFDRTDETEISREQWSYSPLTGSVTITRAVPWHKYTVNFLTVRIWEEISMYNHITNNWGDREHLMAVEPMYPETRAHILEWLEDWCIRHPHTTVVRFTSMFYNFAWFWSDDERNRSLYSDWGSYHFTVNPVSLREFEKKNGYKITSEDFVNGGRYNATHNVPSKEYLDWMKFINRFVVDFGRECIDLVHRYHKKAYVFYDDSWIGVEPYSELFEEFGFDGIIKCVFSGFEARLCAGVTGVNIHELRLHPYLFPTGLKGEPTFAPCGDPTKDARQYWVNIRRALLRAPIDRIGLGGYLHLVEPFPDFINCIAGIAEEFCKIKALHKDGRPYTNPGKVLILTAWGKLRSWICSGHLHEHPEIDLTNLLEALSGLLFDVDFISFDDICMKGIPGDAKVIINAGIKGSAWSGGEHWKREGVIREITRWVAQGGSFLGVNEPSACDSPDTYFRLSHILGVDRDTGDRICCGKYSFDVLPDHFILQDTKDIGERMKKVEGIYIYDKKVKVLAQQDGVPVITLNEYEKGYGIYLSGFQYSNESTRLLLRILYYLMGMEKSAGAFVSSNLNTECAYYPEDKTLVVINNSGETQSTQITTLKGRVQQFVLQPYETVFVLLK